MNLSYLTVIKKMFGGKELSEDERSNLVKETMVMTLARVTRSDSNIEAVEIEKVQQVLKDQLGEDLTAADIRVAASSELFEAEPLDRYLSKAGYLLNEADKEQIARALADVIHADGEVRSNETDFFDSVVKELGVSDETVSAIRGGI